MHIHQTPEHYISNLNYLLTSDNYSNEYLDRAKDLLIEIEALTGLEYNSVKLKAHRLERMLEAEWYSTSYQLYANCVVHPGKFNSIEKYINDSALLF
jgi:hypothetical protein